MEAPGGERRRRPWGRFLMLGAVAALGMGWVSLAGVHHLEADNDFCHSCHINGKPLHPEQHRQLTRGEGPSLAAGHAVRISEKGGRRRSMRCVDCHTGITFSESIRFHWVAFRDMLVYVAGQGEEPQALSRPMPDHNCTRCHKTIRSGAFHQIPAHHGEMRIRCAECHTVHVGGGGPARTDPASTPTLCARCHPGLSDQVLRLTGALPPVPETPSTPIPVRAPFTR